MPYSRIFHFYDGGQHIWLEETGQCPGKSYTTQVVVKASQIVKSSRKTGVPRLFDKTPLSFTTMQHNSLDEIWSEKV